MAFLSGSITEVVLDSNILQAKYSMVGLVAPSTVAILNK
jgi:hypothetical protein